VNSASQEFENYLRQQESTNHNSQSVASQKSDQNMPGVEITIDGPLNDKCVDFQGLSGPFLQGIFDQEFVETVGAAIQTTSGLKLDGEQISTSIGANGANNIQFISTAQSTSNNIGGQAQGNG